MWKGRRKWRNRRRTQSVTRLDLKFSFRKLIFFTFQIVYRNYYESTRITFYFILVVVVVVVVLHVTIGAMSNGRLSLCMERKLRFIEFRRKSRMRLERSTETARSPIEFESPWKVPPLFWRQRYIFLNSNLIPRSSPPDSRFITFIYPPFQTHRNCVATLTMLKRCSRIWIWPKVYSAGVQLVWKMRTNCCATWRVAPCKASFSA